MLRGPVLLEDLGGLLIRFRLPKIAIVADIEKAFHQVSLCQRDRDVTRFLWLKDAHRPVSDANLQIYRFCRVPFGAIASPFLLAATVKHHVLHSSSPIADKILRHLYVDNLVTGVGCVEEACDFYKKAKSLFYSASMNLREWASNSSSLEDTIPNADLVGTSSLKVLGLVWERRSDTLQLPAPNECQLRTSNTKRGVLRSVSSLFDPLGLVAPATLNAKHFIQMLWREKLSWDDPLPNEKLAQWRPIADDLVTAAEFRIPRRVCQTVSNCQSYQLHCFCDASKIAYGTAVYIRCEGNEDENHTDVQLVFGKTRLAPLTVPSIPRLELLAALIGIRALQYVRQHLHMDGLLDSCHLWSDSKCVLHWIRSTKPLSVFVSNRIREIRQCSDVSFHYIHTTHNPADIASRGISLGSLKTNTLWWEGPSWLREHANDWPAFDFEITTPEVLEAISSETKGPCILFETSLLSDLPFSPAPFGISYNNFSKLRKLLQVTYLCQKFLCLIQRKVPPADVNLARVLWERYVQQKHFRSATDRNIVKQLGLKVDSDGVIRCYGRLHNAEIPYDAKYPKLLPRNDHLTYLIVMDCHERLFHAGVAHTLSQVRYSYWIPHGRATVKRMLKLCVPCKRHQTGPYVMPRMPPLPRERVSQSAPFSCTGLDYLGPLIVKDENIPKKVWICLFTCLAVRAITLEVVCDMSAYQFLLSLRRFIAQRGRPSHFVSDNAASFKLVSATVHKAWSNVTADESVTSFLAKEAIKWNYIPEFSPWMGGLYERLVGIVKSSMRKSIGRLCLTTIQLQTLVKEIEAIVNTRPLVYVDQDVNEPIVLTPAHFLGGNTMLGTPEFPEEDVDFAKLSSRDALLEKWKRSQAHLQAFWSVWSDQYLLALRERFQSHHKQPRVRNEITPKENTVVIVRDTGHSRNSWKLGKIVSLSQSADGEVRSARLRTANGRHINRPLSMLYPIECPADDSINQQEHKLTTKLPSQRPPTHKTPYS